MILFHVIIALSSLIYSTLFYVYPSKARVYGSCILAALTLGSGIYLTVATHVSILQVCLSGLAYTAVISFLIAAGQRKLATSADNQNRPA